MKLTYIVTIALPGIVDDKSIENYRLYRRVLEYADGALNCTLDDIAEYVRGEIDESASTDLALGE